MKPAKPVACDECTGDAMRTRGGSERLGANAVPEFPARAITITGQGGFGGGLDSDVRKMAANHGPMFRGNLAFECGVERQLQVETPKFAAPRPSAAGMDAIKSHDPINETDLPHLRGDDVNRP